MPKGGARNRSGPPKDPNSGRSERSGFSLTALPNEGHQDEAPAFPLSARRVMRWEFEDKRRYQVLDEETTAIVADREAELWSWAWSTPQAAAWSREPWRWQTVAMWVRTFVICEGDEATAADKSAIHRFADQIGLTPAGLKENGWAIAPAVIEAAEDEAEPEEVEDEEPPARRLSAV